MSSKQRFYSLHSKNKASLYTAIFVFFIDTFGWAVVFPLFAPLVLDPTYGILGSNTSAAMQNFAIAAMFSAYPLMQFFGAPFFGDVADRLGRKKAFLIALSGVAVGYFFSAFALTARSYFALLISRLVTGFFAGTINISFATIADMSNSIQDRARNFNAISILGGLAWVLATLTGGDLSDPHLLRIFHPSVPFFIAGGLSTITLFVVWKFFRETCSQIKGNRFKFLQALKDIKTAFSIPKVKVLFFAYLIWGIAWIMILSWFAAFSIDRFGFSQPKISYILLVNGLLWMAINLVCYHYLINKFSLPALVLTGYLCAGLATLIASIGNPVTYIIFFLIAIAFLALLWSTTLSMISLNAPDHLQGVTLGVGQSVFALGIILGPLLAGYFDSFNPAVPYIVAGTLLLIGFFVVLGWNIRHKAKS